MAPPTHLVTSSHLLSYTASKLMNHSGAIPLHCFQEHLFLIGTRMSHCFLYRHLHLRGKVNLNVCLHFHVGYHKYCEKSCSLPLPVRIIRSFNCYRKRKGIFSTIFIQMCKVVEAGLPNRASGDIPAVCRGRGTQSHFCQSRQYDSCGFQQKPDLALQDPHHTPHRALHSNHPTQGIAPVKDKQTSVCSSDLGSRWLRRHG